jgi:hypothetical protein
VDVAAVSANGVRDADGACTFETTDPNFFLPFSGPLSRLTVRGWWDIQPAEAVRARYHAVLAERDALRAELASREEQLQGILASRGWRAFHRMHSFWRLLSGRRAA